MSLPTNEAVMRLKLRKEKKELVKPNTLQKRKESILREMR